MKVFVSEKISMFKEDMLFKTHPDLDPNLQKVNPRTLEKADPIQNSLYELKNYFCQIQRCYFRCY